VSIDTTLSTESGRKGRRRDPTVFACNHCGETRPGEFYAYRPTSCRRCHISAVLRSRDPERHRAAQRRYRQRLLERGGELQRADERDPYTLAVLAVNKRLAEEHPAEFASMLMDEFNRRGLDSATYLERHNIAPGSFQRFT
jgi:hypothetical protein